MEIKAMPYSTENFEQFLRNFAEELYHRAAASKSRDERMAIKGVQHSLERALEKSGLRLFERAAQNEHLDIQSHDSIDLQNTGLTNQEVVELLFSRWKVEYLVDETGKWDKAKLLALDVGLMCLFDDNVEAEKAWINTDNPGLGGARPIDFIRNGQLDAVIAQINRERNLDG